VETNKLNTKTNFFANKNTPQISKKNEVTIRISDLGDVTKLNFGEKDNNYLFSSRSLKENKNRVFLKQNF